MAKKQYVDPPRDVVLRGIAYAQTLSLGTYYVFENGYYLAGKGVLRGWTAGDVKRWAKVSLRCFLGFVVLEFVRLWRVREMRERSKVGVVDGEGEGGEGIRIRKEEEGWARALRINAAYAPLSMHWASEGELLGDGVVGALMSYVGWVKFRAAWAAAA